MKKALGKLNRAYILLLILMASAVTLLGIYQVLARYVFKWPIFWTEEVIRYVYIATVMLGINFAAKTEAYTAITLVSDSIARRSKTGYKVLKLIHHLVQLIFFALLMYWGARLAIHAGNQNQFSSAVKIPFVLVYLPIPIGGLMGVADAVEKIIMLFQARPPQEHTGSEEVHVV
ncbi:TRAP transporter small permease [Marasmitruncus massiliensis]|uniref:TRAP transporter small permease n=1 Tax=Marasmitruncus massiliensis TaxID=1944642 RepID=UPI000C7C42EA|nr:TRAP transporter small permease subunit [Marasmitruncus massiliensis]